MDVYGPVVRGGRADRLENRTHAGEGRGAGQVLCLPWVHSRICWAGCSFVRATGPVSPAPKLARLRISLAPRGGISKSRPGPCSWSPGPP